MVGCELARDSPHFLCTMYSVMAMSVPYVVTYICVSILAVCFVVLYVEYKLSDVRRQIVEFEEAILSHLDRTVGPSSPK